MASALGVLISGANTVKVSFPLAIQLVGIGCVGAATVRVAVSRDPNVTAAALVAPSTSVNDANLIAVIGGGATAEFPAVEVPEGEAIYCAATAATSLVLYTAENLQN
jgi:hypothetical protein